MNDLSIKVTGIILAGGASSRMGANKASAVLGRETMLERALLLMESVCDTLIISANTDEYNHLNFPVVKDNYSNIGPLGGIEAALSVSQTRHNFVVSCDTPFVPNTVFYAIAREFKNETAIIPRVNGKLVATVGYYSKEILPFVHQQIQSGNYKLQDLLHQCKTSYLDFDHAEAFMNINTINDLQMALAFVRPSFPNMVLISGNGRNVGKTTLACQAVRKLAQCHEVTGIKITNHFHPVDNKHEIIAQTPDYIIVKELAESCKDSSLMLQAGAKNVYFIMSKKESTGEAFMHIADKLAGHPVVCESGGLRDYIHPGLFLFVNSFGKPIEKPWLLNGIPIMVTNHDFRFDFDVKQIGFINKQINLKNLFYGNV